MGVRAESLNGEEGYKILHDVLNQIKHLNFPTRPKEKEKYKDIYCA